MNFQRKGKDSNDISIFEYIKDTVTIKEAAASLALEFETSGHDLKCSCPTGHPSQSGRSFVMSTETNLFYCYNCGLGGSVIDLVSVMLNLSIKDSLKWIVDAFNLEDKVDRSKIKNLEISPEKIKTEHSRLQAHKLLEEVFRWGKEKLYEEEAKEVMQYLTEERKYDRDRLKETEFFYFPPENEIRQHLLEVFPDCGEAIKTLPLKGALGDNIRLAFPYRNRRGMITGIIKRVPSAKGQQKFNKGIPIRNKDGQYVYERYDSTYRTVKEDLFGLDKIKKADTLLIVEGYPDAIYLPALAFRNVAALGQGLFSRRHINGLIAKNIKNVIIALDNDKVGPKNSLRAIELLLSLSDINVYVLEQTKLNPYKDPDEYVRANGIESFKKLLLEAEEGELWYLKQICPGGIQGSAITRREAYEKALRFCLLIKSESIRSEYLEMMAELFKRKKGDISADFRKMKSSLSAKRYMEEKHSFSKRLNERYVAFIEKGTNTYSYYCKDSDEVYLGVGKDILEQILLSRGQLMPDVFPVLKAVYNPLVDRKFDFEKEEFNLFSPSKYMLLDKTSQSIELEKDCPSIARLLGNLLPKPDERERFINWLSGIMQTRQKQMTAWVFKGAQGTGKNLLRERVLQPLFGQRQVIQVEDQMLESEFNGYLKNVMMIAFNEVANKDNSSRNGVKSKIKAIITDKEIWINEKSIRPFPIENFVNCMFFSNEGVPVMIEDGDRRFNVVSTGRPLRELAWFSSDPEGFISSLDKEMPAFAQYLMNYDYDPIMAKTVFMNDEKEALIKVGMNRFQEFALHLKEGDFEWFNENQTVNSKDPFDHIKTITSEDVKGKILKDLALDIFCRIYPKSQETKKSLLQNLELYGIKAERRYDKNGNRQNYYTW